MRSNDVLIWAHIEMTAVLPMSGSPISDSENGNNKENLQLCHPIRVGRIIIQNTAEYCWCIKNWTKFEIALWVEKRLKVMIKVY